VAVALAGVTAAGIPASGQVAGSAPEVANIEFEGNVAFPDDSLRLAIYNRRTECRTFVIAPFCWLDWDFAFQKEYLVRRELERDVVRLYVYYSERGYRGARVDTTLAYDPQRAETNITFHIQEGEPVRIDSLSFVGADVLGEGRLLRALPVAEGDPLSLIKLEQARDSLLTRLRNEGYVHADVFLQRFIPQDHPLAARVTFEIDPGPMAHVGALNILVTGDAELSESVVREMLPFREGSVYSQADVQQGQRNLYNLEIVRNALIELDTVAMSAAPDTLVPILVEVGTSTLHRVRLGGGWNMADCMSAEARWTSRNVFGGAQRLQVTGRISNILSEELHGTFFCPYSGVDEFGGVNWALSTELNLPAVISPRNSLNTSLFWERQSLPDVFIREAVGLSIVLTRSFRPRMPLSLSYTPQYTGLEAAGIFFCTSLLVCSPEDVDVLEDPNWLAPLAIATTRDRTNDPLNPSQGYSAHLEVEHADGWTGSDFKYTRVAGDLSRYWELARRTVFAFRLRAGAVGNAEFEQVEGSGLQIVNPQKRFYGGGANSVRGVPQNRLGPQILTVDPALLIGPAQVVDGDTVLLGHCDPEEIVAFTCDANPLEDDAFTPRPTGGTRLLEGNVEYRFAVSDNFQGVTFLDFGQVWEERTDIDLGALEWTPGLGARYFSPIGPLRVDVAYRFGGGEHLSAVTSRIRPLGPDDDPRQQICLDLVGVRGGAVSNEICGTNRVPIPWVGQDELALLAPPVTFGADRSFFSRIQIHLSIGQAF
jgi:outer membrane protein assembly complex protein YaeT